MAHEYIPQTELLDLLHHHIEQHLRQSNPDGRCRSDVQPAHSLYIDRPLFSTRLNDTSRISASEDTALLERGVGELV